MKKYIYYFTFNYLNRHIRDIKATKTGLNYFYQLR